MTPTRLTLNLLGAALIMTAIGIFGPMLSRKIDADFRKGIDRNGISVKGVITDIASRKGGTRIYFQYNYNNKLFSDYEVSHFADELRVGDSVLMQIDSSSPGDAYILGRW